MKKTFSILFSILIILSLAIPAAAELLIAENPVSDAGILIAENPVAGEVKYNSMLVLGDSISTGYGLAGYSSSNPYDCASYANQLAAYFGLKAGETYLNKAVNGDRTGDLFSLLPSMKKYVGQSELIVISIGGNNLLKNVSTIASAISGVPVSGLQQAAIALASATEEDCAKAMQNDTVSSAVNKAIADIETDIVNICKLIKKYNPNARTVFLRQYNPVKDLQLSKGLSALGGMLIGMINERIDAAVTAAGTGFELADVPSVIDDNATGKTNILQMDIHPNALGHSEIYKLLSAQLSVAPEGPEETTECVHEWGEWTEVSEGLTNEKRVLERRCVKCDASEQKEETPAETGAIADDTSGDITSAPELTTGDGSDNGQTGTKSGCTLTASATAASMLAAAFAAFITFKKKRD